MHLPIERDWWWRSNFCVPRENESFARRCLSPAQAAHVTARHRADLGAKGLFLMYAHDKVSPRGPAVCVDDFGPGSTSYKLALPQSLGYTIRNAAEQFFAASAPVAFYGNLLSTFSKGVALLRAMRQLPSFAYDCAWNRNTSASPVVRAHPGFGYLRPLPQARCALGEDDDSEPAQVARWAKRGEPPMR